MNFSDLYMKLGTAIIVGLLLVVTPVQAERRQSRPTVQVYPQATVSGDKILLKDIAKIRSSEPEFKELTNKLENIVISESPAPKTRTSILGPKVLEAIESAGIPLDTFGYSIPKIVFVERAGRTLENEEILAAVRGAITGDAALDLQVREIVYSNDQIIPNGATEFKVEKLGTSAAGKLPLRIEVYVDKLPAARFMATALVDDWREVPVLSRALERGMLIGPQDIELVRLNLLKQPTDVVGNADELIGRRAKSRLAAGETIRRALVDLPPVVEKGRVVAISYRSGGLYATATGVALADGLTGDEIPVKNESSQKILKARILNPSEVEVKAQ